MEILVQTLNISGVGIALVFAGILILWGMMALLVRLFREKQHQPDQNTDALDNTNTTNESRKKAALAAVAVALASNYLKPKAAAAAVVCALSLGIHPIMEKAHGTNFNSWQIANRIVQLNQRNQTFIRRPRGK